MYREEIKVLDCTIRDGGLINQYQFRDSFVEACYHAACESGVDVVELGKKLCESDEYTRDKWGKWNFCEEDDLKRVVDSYEGSYRPQLAVMYDVGRVDIDGLVATDQSPVDMIRTACYVADIDNDGFGEILDRPIVLAQFIVGNTPFNVGNCVLRIEADSLVVVIYRSLILT